jgi:two-component system OmpR family response regulator
LSRQLADTLKEAGYVVDQAVEGEEGRLVGDAAP